MTFNQQRRKLIAIAVLLQEKYPHRFEFSSATWLSALVYDKLAQVNYTIKDYGVSNEIRDANLTAIHNLREVLRKKK